MFCSSKLFETLAIFVITYFLKINAFNQDMSIMSVRKLVKLLRILREIRNQERDGEVESARNNQLFNTSPFSSNKNADRLESAHKTEIYSVSKNVDSFQASSISMFTDISKKELRSSCVVLKRTFQSLDLSNEYHSYVSLASMAEEHSSTTSSSCKTSLTSLYNRKRSSYRPSKLKRSLKQSALCPENSVTFNVECASTPIKKLPRSSTPRVIRRERFVPENTRSYSMLHTNDLFFPTFFSNFVSLISSN